MVENGKALGACRCYDFKPDVLLTSDTHQSYARNEAINWVKSHGGGMWGPIRKNDKMGSVSRQFNEKLHALIDKEQ